MRRNAAILGAALAFLLFRPIPWASAADAALGIGQLVDLALEVNPQVRAARARWDSAAHQIKQAYAPVDPVFTYSSVDSNTNGFSRASLHSLNLSQPVQFPGKALIQGDVAKRNAEIARLAYRVAVRDTRARIEAAYYQYVLDAALGDQTADNVANLKRVLKVTEVAYSANQVTQTDFISAEFDLAAAQQLERQFRANEANDKTLVNQILNRAPVEPLELDRKLELAAIETALDPLIDGAAQARQEILQTALAETNSEDALKLAKMEYLPDFILGLTFDHYLLVPAAPDTNRLEDIGVSIGFNLPIYFWAKQREDVTRAKYDLAAARDDLGSIRAQTAAAVTSLYRQAGVSYRTATLYRDSLIPLARQGFEVALIAYQSSKVDFLTLSTALRRNYESRVAYMQAANQFLGVRVALEQTIGEPLPK
jgi:cobalt-zinc-cadmium efflux system outer membrane protein